MVNEIRCLDVRSTVQKRGDNENQPIYRVLRPDQLVTVEGEMVLVSLVRIQNIPKTTFDKELLLEILRRKQRRSRVAYRKGHDGQQLPEPQYPDRG